MSLTATETEKHEIVVAGHRFNVWVRVIDQIADDEVRRALAYQDELKAEASTWRPYDKPRGDEHVAHSILNASNIGVEYVGPV
jgi:hypothetical protein